MLGDLGKRPHVLSLRIVRYTQTQISPGTCGHTDTIFIPVTYTWDDDFLDLVEKAHITLRGRANSKIAFDALNGDLDVRYGSREGAARAEFSGKVTTKAIPSVAGAGSLSAPPAVSSAISIYTKATNSRFVAERELTSSTAP